MQIMALVRQAGSSVTLRAPQLSQSKAPHEASLPLILGGSSRGPKGRPTQARILTRPL